MQEAKIELVMVPKSKIEEMEKRIAALEKQVQERQIEISSVTVNSDAVLERITKGLEEAVTGEKLLNGYCNSKEKPLVSVSADSDQAAAKISQKPGNSSLRKCSTFLKPQRKIAMRRNCARLRNPCAIAILP